MNRISLACSLFIVGCGATIDLSSSDAGPDGTRGGNVPTAPPPEQQVSTSLPSWCPQICAKMVQCQMPGADSTCVASCNDVVGQTFSGHGNACAQLGLNFMSCMNDLSCTDMSNNSKACNPQTPAIQAACNNGDADASAPDGSAPYPVVSCQSGSGMATGGGPIPIGATVCQNNVTACTDGHSYSIDCINAGNNQMSCTCYRDGAMGVTFGTPGTSCPYVPVVNASCGWQLVSI